MSGVMVSALAFSVVDCPFYPCRVQLKTIKSVFSSFSTKIAALRSKSRLVDSESE